MPEDGITRSPALGRLRRTLCCRTHAVAEGRCRGQDSTLQDRGGDSNPYLFRLETGCEHGAVSLGMALDEKGRSLRLHAGSYARVRIGVSATRNHWCKNQIYGDDMKKTYVAPIVRCSGGIVSDTLCGPTPGPSEYPAMYNKRFAGAIGFYL